MSGMKDPYDVRCPCGANLFYYDLLVRVFHEPPSYEPAIDFARRVFREPPFYCPMCHRLVVEK